MLSKRKVKINVQRRERIPKFGFEMTVSKGRQMGQICDSTVVEAPIQIPFSTLTIKN